MTPSLFPVRSTVTHTKVDPLTACGVTGVRGSVGRASDSRCCDNHWISDPSFFGIFWYFVHFVVPMGISPMGNLGRFPEGKPAVTESLYPTLINWKVHAGSFLFFIIHQTLTWTTGSLTCVCDHSYSCVGTHEQWVSTVFLTLGEKLPQIFLCSWCRRTSNFGSLDPTLYQLSHPVTLSGAQDKFVRVFLSQKYCADSLSVCPTPVCIRTHKNDHVRTLKVM